jgi:hypothetical protein
MFRLRSTQMERPLNPHPARRKLLIAVAILLLLLVVSALWSFPGHGSGGMKLG